MPINKLKKIPQLFKRLNRYRKNQNANHLFGFEQNLDVYYSGDYKIYSFDVFDTVLTRQVGTGENLFKLLQESLSSKDLNLPKEFVDNFYEWRISAEKEARKKFHSEGNSIEDIYKTIPEKYQISNEMRNLIMDLEIQFEIEQATPISKVVDLIEHLHATGQKVIYISDMYLPKEVIQQMLKKVGAFEKGDELFVSNEYRLTKSSSGLYEYLLKQFKCKPQEIIHLGDNYHADVINANKFKIKSIHFNKSQYNLTEQLILRSGLASDNVQMGKTLALMAEASRLARLKQSSTDHDNLYKLGTTVAGPILYSFVSWLLKKAKQDNIDALYFLARDGQILMEIAQHIKKRLSLDIDLRYLYVSRQSTLLPSISEIGDSELKWILLKTPYLSLRILANRVGCSIDQISSEFEKLRGKKVNVDNPLTDYEIKLLEHLLRNNTLSELILETAKQKRKEITEYFKQEKLFDKEKSYALVDLGWQCSIQSSMEEIFRLEGKDVNDAFKGYYFGVVHPRNGTQGETKREGFYFSPDHEVNKECPISWRAMQILEIFATGDHGITLDYESNNNLIIPKLKETHNEDAYQWGLVHLRLGIFEFLNSLPEKELDYLNEYKHEYFFEIIQKVFQRLISNPQKDEADALGSYPFKSDQAETYQYEYAPKFTWLKAIRYALLIPMSKRESMSTWFHASYRRSPFAVRLTLRILLSKIFQWPRGVLCKVFSLRKKLSTQKLKVAVVAYKFPCISETFILNQIIGLIDLGHHVDVFAFEGPSEKEQTHQAVIDYKLKNKTTYISKTSKGRFIAFFEAIRIIIRYLPFYPETIFRCMNFRKYKVFEIIHNLRKTAPFLKQPYDIIHCHFGPIGNEINKINQFLTKTRLIVTFHGYDVNRTPKEKGPDVYKNLFAQDNHYTANTNFTKNLVVELGANEKSVDVLPVGVKMDRLKFVPKEFPEDGIVQFLTVGRLVEKKGHKYAFEALHKLVQHNQNVQYLLVGDGPLEEELKQLAKELNIEQYIQFLGALKEREVIELYEQAHIFVLPSVTASDGDREGQALVLQEAQAVGMPVISTIHNGIPDGVLDGESGFLVEEKNAEALFERMKFLLDNSQKWFDMGQTGRRFVGGKYNIGWLNDRLEEIYYKVRKL